MNKWDLTTKYITEKITYRKEDSRILASEHVHIPSWPKKT